MWLIAQNALKDEQARSSLMMWLGILLVVIIVGFGLIMMLRRMLRAPEEGTSHDPGFSLSELRAMRDRGEITPEEYEVTRARVIEKVKKMPGPKRKGRPDQGGDGGGEGGDEGSGV